MIRMSTTPVKSLWENRLALAASAAQHKEHYRRASVVSRLSHFKVVRDQLALLLRLRALMPTA